MHVILYIHDKTRAAVKETRDARAKAKTGGVLLRLVRSRARGHRLGIPWLGE